MSNLIDTISKAVASLSARGIVPVDKPTEWVAYIGGWGSISNYGKIIVGSIRQECVFGDTETLVVHVEYIREKESGEILADTYVHERRYVALDKLWEFLDARGFRER